MCIIIHTWFTLARVRTILAGPSFRGAVETRTFVDTTVSWRPPIGLTLAHVRFVGTSSMFTGHAAFTDGLTMFPCIHKRQMGFCIK